jgi:hypothetical protein
MTSKESFQKHNLRITELEKRSADYASKSEFEKTAGEVKILKESFENLMKQLIDHKKWTATEVTSINKQMEKFATIDEHNILK